MKTFKAEMQGYLKVAGSEADQIEERSPIKAPAPTGVIFKLRDADAAHKVADWIKAFGATGNIERVDECAGTRLHVALSNKAALAEAVLATAGVEALVTLPTPTIHLLVGVNADQYAAEMRSQLGLPLAA